MQFLIQAGIVKKPPRWVAVVEAFPPLPTPPVTGTRTKEIVYKEEDQRRKKLQQSLKKPKLLSLFEVYDIAGMPENKPVDLQDTAMTDVGDSIASEDIDSKQEQAGDTGYMSTLEIIDDLKQPTNRNDDGSAGDMKESKVNKSSLAGEKDTEKDIGDIFDSLESTKKS